MQSISNSSHDHESVAPEGGNESSQLHGKVANGHQQLPHTPSGSESSQGRSLSRRLVSAYDVTLLVRSRNPTGDAHDPNIEGDDIPSHHVPSIVSIASKTLRQRSRKPESSHRERAKAKAWRAAEAVKSTSTVPPAYWRSGGSKRFVQPAASQPSAAASALPLLSFRNPWESFQPPTLLGVWKGLKWGLPEEYIEGGHSKYRGRGRKATHADEEYRKAEAELGKGWADIQVMAPNWGWVEAERKTWLEGANVEREKAEEAAKRISTDSYGRRKEWQDPRADRPLNHARVSWLGHASTLLQLPPLADPSTKADPHVEREAGTTSGGIEYSLDGEQARKIVDQIAVSNEEIAGQKGSRGRQIVIKQEPPEKRDLRQSGRLSGGKNGIDGLPPKSKSDRLAIAREDQDGDVQSEADAETDSQDLPPAEIDNVRERSINILFDPVFSKRCSPSQTVGPVRFTEAPCKPEDLPPIDLILLSHDHYDHSDVESLKKIRHARGNAVHVFVGLGNKDWLCSAAGFQKSQVSELDWWDEAVLTASGPPSPPGDVARAALRVICTPAQHGSGRVPGGKDSTLWCSWVIEQITPAEPPHGSQPYQGRSADEPNESTKVQTAAPAPPPREHQQTRWRAFFAGDTGLRRHGEKFTGRKSPVCPAFEEISRRYGVPHLFLLPISIGSSLSYLRSKDPFPRRYSPFPRVSESLTSSIHMDAEDAVEMLDIMTSSSAGSKEQLPDASVNKMTPIALAVHFGTFVRNAEQTKTDVRNLRNACRRHKVQFGRTHEGRFDHLNEGRHDQRAPSANSSSGQAAKTSSESPKSKFLVSHQGETVWVKM